MKLTTRYGEGMNHKGPCWPLGRMVRKTVDPTVYSYPPCSSATCMMSRWSGTFSMVARRRLRTVFGLVA